MIVILMGIQGCGKGTQSQLLCRAKNFRHVNLGELFRMHVSLQTEIGKKADSYISKGLLVPDEVVFEVIESGLAEAATGKILDGFPRTLAQAEYLSQKHQIDKVISLELSDKIAKERMLARRNCSMCKKEYNLQNNPPKTADVCDICGGPLECRADDKPDLIDNRIDLFHKETKPLLDYYQKMGVLSIIDASGQINDIHQEILRVLQ